MSIEHECPRCGQKIKRNSLAIASHERKHDREDLQALDPKQGEYLVLMPGREPEQVVKVLGCGDGIVNFVASATAGSTIRSARPSYFRRPPAGVCPGSGMKVRLGHLRIAGAQCPVCGRIFPKLYAEGKYDYPDHQPEAEGRVAS